MQRVLTVVVLMILSGARFAADASCVGGPPFLTTAKYADVVFLARSTNDSHLTVLNVIRGSAPSAPVFGAALSAPPGSKWLVAARRDSKRGGYFIPECSVSVLAVTGEWAIGAISSERSWWWQAAPLNDVLAAVSTGAESVTSVGDPAKVIPFVGEARPTAPLRVDVHRDCAVPRTSISVRVLLDEEGFVRRAGPVTGLGKCLNDVVMVAVSRMRMEPARPHGYPATSWAEVTVELPYTEPGSSCSRGHSLRPPTAVVAYDGKRLVITARPSSFNEAALRRMSENVTASELGAAVDALDLKSAPRLVEFTDDNPCGHDVRDGMWSPGNLRRERSILAPHVCIQYDGSRECPNGRGSAAANTNWFEGAPAETKQIAIDSDELTIPGDLFIGDVVLLVLTPGKGVRPADGKLWSLPPRFIVGNEDGRDWPRFYSEYLDAVCRGSQTVLVESADDLRSWLLTFARPLEVEEYQQLGATWYPQRTADEHAARLDLTRLRVLRSGSSAIRLAFEDYRRDIDGAVYARFDADVAEPPCRAGAAYRSDAPRRRAEELKNRLRMTDPWSPHDD